MVCALDGVVAPPGQQVTRVYHDGTRDGRRAHPRAPGRLDLQTTDVVLEQQGDGTVVGVLAGANLVGVPPPDALLDGRVVQEAESVVAGVGITVEETFVVTHAESDGAHDLDVQVFEPQGKPLHVIREFLAFIVTESRWPLVGKTRHSLTPDLDRLFQVRVRRS